MSAARAKGGPLIVALLESRGKFMVAEPFFPPPRTGAAEPPRGHRRQLVVQRSRDARPGTLVLLQGQGSARPKVLKTLGKPEIARDVLEALMLHRGLARDFPPGVVRAAREAVESVAADPARRDLRDLETFTIDPATARDFDDAISAQEIGKNTWRVWVHIADVSAYVRAGSQLDREAYRRSTSVYVPGLVEPMLPPELSNGACSLVPGEDRNAVTAELEFHGAEVVKAAFYRSLIRSDRRYDYEEVDALFADGAELELPLAAARAVASALDAERVLRGALEIDSVEPDFEFDRAGHVVAQHRRHQTESHRLIEHLMIAANEQVAKLLEGRGVPALYRIHERPASESAKRLLEQLESLGIPTPPAPEEISPSQAGEIVAAASALVAAHVRRTGRGGKGLTSLVLRSLQQARYSPANKGHAGLGLTHYCHFTSPIRRYPDLIVHRALLSAIGGGDPPPRGGAMDEAGEWTSSRERDAMVIERNADDIARCFLLERELRTGGWEQAFEGEVIAVIGAGAFVAFGDGHEGMVPVRMLGSADPAGPRDWWELNEQGTILFASESGAAISVGDPMTVRVARVDVPRGRTDLERVSEPSEPGRAVTSSRHGQGKAKSRRR